MTCLGSLLRAPRLLFLVFCAGLSACAGPARPGSAPAAQPQPLGGDSYEPLDLESAWLQLEVRDQPGGLVGRARLELSEPRQGAFALALAGELELLELSDDQGRALAFERRGDTVLAEARGARSLWARFAGEPLQGLTFEQGGLFWQRSASGAGAWFPRSTDAADELLVDLEMTWPAGWAGLATGRELGSGRFQSRRALRAADVAVAGGPDWRLVREPGLRVLGPRADLAQVAQRVAAAAAAWEQAFARPAPWSELTVLLPAAEADQAAGREGGRGLGPGSVGHAWIVPRGDAALETLLAQAWLEAEWPRNSAQAAALARAWSDPGSPGPWPQLSWLARAREAGQVEEAQLRRWIGAWASTAGGWNSQVQGDARWAAWRQRPAGPVLELRPRWDGSSRSLVLNLAQRQEIGSEGAAQAFEGSLELLVGTTAGQRSLQLDYRRRREIFELDLPDVEEVLWLDARTMGPGKVVVLQAAKAWMGQAWEAEDDRSRGRAWSALAALVREGEEVQLAAQGPVSGKKIIEGPLTMIGYLELQHAYGLGDPAAQQSALLAHMLQGPVQARAAAASLRRLELTEAGLRQRGTWARANLARAQDVETQALVSWLWIGADSQEALAFWMPRLGRTDPRLLPDLVALLGRAADPEAFAAALGPLLRQGSSAQRGAVILGLLELRPEAWESLRELALRRAPSEEFTWALEQQRSIGS